MKKQSIILVFIFGTSILSAQVADSIKPSAKHPLVQYFQEKDFFPHNTSYKSVDTSMDGVQKYFPNNFPYSLGLANRKLFFNPSAEIGFVSGFDYLDLFGYDNDETKYYHTRTPYTELFVVFGMKKEQYSKILHTQNITKQWNIALNMLRIRSTGYYQRQNCTDNNISLSTNYTSKNNRYSLLANGTVSSIKASENGGVVNDLYFSGNLFGDKLLVPVNLPDARTARGNRNIYIKQFLYFGKKEKQTKGDSVVATRIEPKYSLSYSVSGGDSWFVYGEGTPNSGYYKNIYFDSTKTLDSTHIYTLQNTISWKSILSKNLSAEISIDQKTSHIVQYGFDSLIGVINKAGSNMFQPPYTAMITNNYITDNTVDLEMGKRPADFYANGFYWNAGGKYIVSGTNQGNYLVNCDLFAIFKNSKKIFFDMMTDSRSVPFIYSTYTSNHFQWENSFNTISETQARLNYLDSKNNFSIGAEMNQVAGYVYFDSTFSPTQFNSTLTIYSAFIQKDFHLKHFHFNNKITWQQASEDVIHLPRFVTNHSLYYQGKWFSKVLNVQLGFDVSYYTSYYADSYMPALGQYYLQNKMLIGNYPYVDFFFNMKIKHVNIFFKTEHLNSGLMGAYYLAPHIPSPDRSIKLGVVWRFYD